MSQRQVKKYLIKERQKRKNRKFYGNYCCEEEFVLKNGINFKMIISLPSDIKQGKVGNCRQNVYQAIQGSIRKYYYCEGYATSGGLVCLHAWLTNSKREVIDPTWNDGKDYYGVIFRDAYASKTMAKHGKYISLIDNWMDKWPLLKMTSKELQRHIIKHKR